MHKKVNVNSLESSSAQGREDVSITSDLENVSDDMDSGYKPDSECSTSESESDNNDSQVCTRKK